MILRSKYSPRWIVAPVAAACVLTLPHAARSDHRAARRDRAVTGSLVSVEVRVDGHWAPLYEAPDFRDRHYFEAERRANYALRIRNRTGERVGVLVSVDGLNVVNGERTTLSPHEPMYVLDPHESATIRGWRTSLDDVRKFVFVDEERSYASRTGQANGDMGWIRVLAFEERPRVARWRPRGGRDGGWDERWKDGRETRERGGARDDDARAEAAQPPPATGKARGDQVQGEPRALEEGSESFPGTGWGDRQRDRVRTTWFEPVDVAGDCIVLRYEYERALADLGIFDRRDRDSLDEREHGEWRFAQPPSR